MLAALLIIRDKKTAADAPGKRNGKLGCTDSAVAHVNEIFLTINSGNIGPVAKVVLGFQVFKHVA